MFCYKCGAKMPDTNKFCPNCGTAVSNAAPMQAPTPTTQTPPTPKIKFRTSTWITVTLTVMLLLSMLILPIANEEIGFRTYSYMLLDNYNEQQGGATVEGLFKSLFFVTTALSALTVLFNIKKKMNFAFLSSFVVLLFWVTIYGPLFGISDNAYPTFGTYVNTLCVIGIFLTNLICGMRKAEY